MGKADRKDAVTDDAVDPVPLVVDLDGTLVRSDLLVESVFALLKRNILFVFVLPLWLAGGRARFKHEVARRVEIDAGMLPYHEEFLDYLKAEHAAGRSLVLATASNERFAGAIAVHLGIFAHVLASDATQNLSGRRKLERLRELFGNDGFAYAANAMVDLPLWNAARHALLVNPERGVWEAAGQTGRVDRIFDDRTGLAAGRNTKHFLLQTYRRDMGGGNYQLMKDLSSPIMVKGRHWGGFRVGFSTE